MRKLAKAIKYRFFHDEVQVDPFGGVVEVPGQEPGDNPKGAEPDDKSGEEGKNGNDLPDGAPKWLAGVSPELREKLMEFKSPNELAQKFLDETASEKIAIPGEGASEDAVAAYWKQIGVPEKAEDYPDLSAEEIPEGVKINLDSAKKDALAAGVPADAFKRFMALRTKNSIADTQGFLDKIKADKTRVEDDLKREYGEDFDSTRQRGELLLTLGGDSFKALDKEKQLSGDPRFMGLVMDIAKRLSEDTLPSGVKVGKQKKKAGFEFESSVNG